MCLHQNKASTKSLCNGHVWDTSGHLGSVFVCCKCSDLYSLFKCLPSRKWESYQNLFPREKHFPTRKGKCKQHFFYKYDYREKNPICILCNILLSINITYQKTNIFCIQNIAHQKVKTVFAVFWQDTFQYP